QSQHESAAISYVRLNAFMFRDKVTATDAEGDEYAKAHADEIQKKYEADLVTRFTQPAAVKVRAITIPVPPNAAPEVEAAARAKIDVALKDVQGGRDIARVAKAQGQDHATKARGGDG